MLDGSRRGFTVKENPKAVIPVKTVECKENRHTECEGWIIPMEWLQHQTKCECICHNPYDFSSTNKKHRHYREE